MTRSYRLVCLAVTVLTLVSGPTLLAQGSSPRIRMVGQQLDLIFKMGPKGTEPPVTAHADGSGMVAVPQSVLASTKPHTRMVVYRCPQPDGSVIVYVLEATAPNPCPGGKPLGAFWLDDHGTVVINPGENGGVTTENETAGTTTHQAVAGVTPIIQLRGFGGASFATSSTQGTAGFNSAVLFPLGNRLLVGPMAGFQWIDNSIVNAIGSHQPGSTFIDSSASFRNGNFGGEIAFPLHGDWALFIHAGATVANSSVTQQSGFCGGTGPTAPLGCTVFNTTTTHDTVVGPFVGGYISHSIFSHVGVFAGFDWIHLNNTNSGTTTSPSSSSSSGSQTSFNVHHNNVVAGLTVTVGGRH
jgi:hypothetical protein